MPSENIKDIQQRLHDLNTEEARLLADVQVSLAGIERIHAQRRVEELTLVELHRKAEDDKREREDRRPRKEQDKQGNQGNQGQAQNKKRGAEAQSKRPKPAKRRRHKEQNNTYGWQGEQGIPVPIPGPSNHGNRHHQSLPGGECKCSRVDVHCGGNGSTCQVCKTLGCGGTAQSSYSNRKKNNEHHGHGEVPGVASSATLTWPHDAASVINIDNIDILG